MREYYAKEGDVITISRKDGKWIVEKAEMSGGGVAMFRDTYPDAWHVWARKLNEDGTYASKRRLLKFTQHTNCYNSVIDSVEKVGQMKKTYV